MRMALISICLVPAHKVMTHEPSRKPSFHHLLSHSQIPIPDAHDYQSTSSPTTVHIQFNIKVPVHSVWCIRDVMILKTRGIPYDFQNFDSFYPLFFPQKYS